MTGRCGSLFGAKGEIFPKARAARKLDLVAMREELEARKEELMSEMNVMA